MYFGQSAGQARDEWLAWVFRAVGEIDVLETAFKQALTVIARAYVRPKNVEHSSVPKHPESWREFI